MTTIRIYRNKRNTNKFLEIHEDGHSHWKVRQFILFENGVLNPTGDGFLHRWRKPWLTEVLEDYEAFGIGTDIFKLWYKNTTRTYRSKMLKAIRRNGR